MTRTVQVLLTLQVPEKLEERFIFKGVHAHLVPGIEHWNPTIEILTKGTNDKAMSGPRPIRE